MTYRIAAAALLAMLATAPAARADLYTLFIYETADELAARTDPQRAEAYWGAYAAYGKALADAGVIRGGAALTFGDAVRTLRQRDGAAAVVPGAATSGPEQLGGYFVIEVADLDTALGWAARAPSALTGAVEVRPAYPAPAMR
ncbi:MAG: YciI family protein [Geminicoccaceae bacterium]